MNRLQHGQRAAGEDVVTLGDVLDAVSDKTLGAQGSVLGCHQQAAAQFCKLLQIEGILCSAEAQSDGGILAMKNSLAMRPMARWSVSTLANPIRGFRHTMSTAGMPVLASRFAMASSRMRAMMPSNPRSFAADAVCVLNGRSIQSRRSCANAAMPFTTSRAHGRKFSTMIAICFMP